jgi:hypothetical protein
VYRSRQEKPKTQEDKAHLLQNDVLDIEDWQVLAETMTILEKFLLLTKQVKGTDTGADEGILSNYITILNNLITHVQTYRDNIKARTVDAAKALESDLYLKACIINW